MIRNVIAETTAATGKAPELESLAARMSLSVGDLLIRIREEPPLESLLGLSSAQAVLLLNHFQDFEMFSVEVRAVIESFTETREKIRHIEKSLKK